MTNDASVLLQADVNFRLDLVKWFTFPPLPIDLRLCYRLPIGNDSLTPTNVRRRYEESSRGRFVFWVSADGSLIGFKEGIDEVTLRNVEFEKLFWCDGFREKVQE